MPALDYLEDYSKQLDSIDGVDDLYEGLLDWQWDRLAEGVQAQEELNAVFFARPRAAPLRLRPENPPTTSVGGFNGIVTIAANPRYTQAANAAEVAFRNDRLGNKIFCESFFDAASGLSKQIRWWESMARFSHTALHGGEPLSTDALWAWAATHRRVGGVDLVPFHSQDDGVTPLIEKPVKTKSANDRTRLKRALRNAAESTFRMVLRLRPPVIFVASAAGTHIAEEVLSKISSKESRNLTCSETTSVWGHEISYQLRWHRLENTNVITMPLQLFSGQLGPIRKLQNPVAKEIKQLVVR